MYFLFTAGDKWNAATCKITSDGKLERNDFVLFQTQFLFTIYSTMLSINTTKERFNEKY